MAPQPDTINTAYEAMKATFIETLAANAADAFVAGEVRAVRQMGIGLNFSLINSRAVEATRAYRDNLVRFGGTDVVEIVNGRPTIVFKPWLKEAVESDRETIGRIIRDGIETGKPLKQVEQALDEVFAMREHDARNTAFRETKVLFNKGSNDRFREEGIRRFIWRHMMPQPHPREEHMERDGKVYDADDPVWIEQDWWFCHCWKEPVIEGRTVVRGEEE